MFCASFNESLYLLNAEAVGVSPSPLGKASLILSFFLWYPPGLFY